MNALGVVLVGIAAIFVFAIIKVWQQKAALLKEPPAWDDVVRAIIAFSLLGAYIMGFILVVIEVVESPESLQNIEGYIALLGVTGVIVREIVSKMFD